MSGDAIEARTAASSEKEASEWRREKSSGLLGFDEGELKGGQRGKLERDTRRSG